VTAAASLLAALRDRGLELRADGERLLARPVERLTPDLRDRVRANRAELLELLRSGDAIVGASVTLERSQAVAWRIYSITLGCELWLAVDERVAREIAAEGTGFAVVTLAEAAALLGKPTAVWLAVLAAKLAFGPSGVEIGEVRGAAAAASARRSRR
jgi:hypothetical protein